MSQRLGHPRHDACPIASPQPGGDAVQRKVSPSLGFDISRDYCYVRLKHHRNCPASHLLSKTVGLGLPIVKTPIVKTVFQTHVLSNNRSPLTS